MAFTTRRGRPPREGTDTPDYGTPELRSKRMLGITVEPIDLCLERGIISERQHWCGLHLRWLYTLRYGAPSLTASYLRERMPRATQSECEQWRASREREYLDATQMLHAHKLSQQVIRVAIHNELPCFLSPALRQHAWNDPALAHRLELSRHRLTDGLQLLVGLWHHPS